MAPKSQERVRKDSYGICGIAFGDEGKGRVVYEIAEMRARKKRVVVYRDNGGANAGHTIEPSKGVRIALHQIPCGVFTPRTTVIVGKDMVVHPAELVGEIENIKKISGGKLIAGLKIDFRTGLALDTHRAFEGAQKRYYRQKAESNGIADKNNHGSTGRGIAPAYAERYERTDINISDLYNFNETAIRTHYQKYRDQIGGLIHEDISNLEVPYFKEKVKVGTEDEFVSRLREAGEKLKSYIDNLDGFIRQTWLDEKYAFIFEKGQGVGLHPQWGIGRDYTASDPTFYGITTSTKGLIDDREIQNRWGVIKGPYMSSVGTRQLPTLMADEVASSLREKTGEFGATTGRPRDMYYNDLPLLRFYTKIARANGVVLTHFDSVDVDTPVRICREYLLDGKSVPFSPDQEFLKQVEPVYQDFPSWDRTRLSRAENIAHLPAEAKNYIGFLEKNINNQVKMVTIGPRRGQAVYLAKNTV